MLIIRRINVIPRLMIIFILTSFGKLGLLSFGMSRSEFFS